MHAGARACAVRTAGWPNSAGTAVVQSLDPRGGRTCSRAATFTATATLQQGACSSAVALSSPLLVQHACEGAEAQQSAARAGRAVDPTRALTAMAAATRRMGGILLGSCFCDNSNFYSTTTCSTGVSSAGMCIDWAA
jgi:hypothetical protein